MSSSTEQKRESDVAGNQNDELRSVSHIRTPLNGATDEIAELRRILVGSEEVSEVLPDALSRSSRRDSQLSEATLPIVEGNIRESVIRNPKVLADALFPVIGPAIRKSIAAALEKMVQAFNQTLEHAVSPKSIGWRLEAMRTGKSFGEVVLLKTLLYRVEQVFLIHRKTGILLQHVAQNPLDTEDADMVSGMLTAITDFAHDSFKSTEDATLDSIQISGLSVWIEGGPAVILAAAIRGNPPLELRERLAVTVEKIQFSFERELNDFNGNTDLFAGSVPELEGCLLSQADESEQKKPAFSPAKVVIGLMGLLVMITIGYFAWDYWRWSGLIEDMKSAPGYVLTDYQRGWMTHSVEGLRDPLAGSPAALLSKNGYDEKDVTFSFREFQDTDPAFVLQRATKMLLPPEGVKLTFENGKLSAEGGSAEWRTDAARLAAFIPGVREVDFVPDKAALISKIEETKVEFNCGTTEPASATESEAAVNMLVELARTGSYEVEIVGHADDTGNKEINRSITKSRAEVMERGIKESLEKESLTAKLKPIASGSEKPSGECGVTFAVKSLNP